ncbi:hypothetical protein ZIOFF_032567 [Zingiber officinale]|uniref:Retrotransposon Copia-like N-terminal domain-containing protein n=1 Tax=Zingiber officinale TaxID=94328 RepID=A0A8J5GJ69_ZINOF|nr:hypothetical protein ZIOFF_032567 [Zingiber officinale]
MANNASETSGISANPMSSSGQVQPVFTMEGTGGSSLQIVSEKLSETNYASWAVVVELYVEGHDKLDILHGTKVKPDEKDPSFRTWRRDNIQLMTWMLNSVNSGIKQVILHNKTAYDMWKKLEQMYGRRHDMLRIYQISSQFSNLNKVLWFESLKGQILGLDPTPSLEQVYYKILSEEGRKRTMNNKGISTGGPPIGETSVFIGSANKFRPGGTKRQGDRFCRHCKRTNHDSDFCWEKYPEKKPEKFKYNAKKAPNSSNIAIQKLESEETIGSSVSSITGLSSTDIVNLQHLLSRLQASSSASTPADSTPFQAHTDGTKATVAGKGSIKLTDHFFLSSALHDLETKQTIGTGREVGGLYYYQLETTSALKSAAKWKLGSRLASTPIEVNHDLTSSSGEDLTSLEKGTYQRLVGKLLYLSMTRPDITYAVSVVSQYMHAPKTIHMKAVDRILSFDDDPNIEGLDNFDQCGSIPEIKVYEEACMIELESERVLPSVMQPSKLELKVLPSHLKYAYLRKEEQLPVIISKDLEPRQEERLLNVLRRHQKAIEYHNKSSKSGEKSSIRTERVPLSSSTETLEERLAEDALGRAGGFPPLLAFVGGTWRSVRTDAREWPFDAIDSSRCKSPRG